ncbi:hypothetical protein BH10ACT11_BH10ACT11_21710 [soil metagenome]
MRVPGGRVVAAALTCSVLGLSIAACGGSKERQDANEPSGDFPVNVAVAKFPSRQRLADTSDLRLKIENPGKQTLPNLAITIYTGDMKASEPFNVRSDQAGLADPNRPIWILEENYPKLLAPEIPVTEVGKAPSAGAETANTDTYAFGSVRPGDSVDALWRVTPVKAGTYTVHYEISAGLYGKAKAVTRDGSKVEGEFVVTISDKPPKTRVSDSGKVETVN